MLFCHARLPRCPVSLGPRYAFCPLVGFHWLVGVLEVPSSFSLIFGFHICSFAWCRGGSDLLLYRLAFGMVGSWHAVLRIQIHTDARARTVYRAYMHVLGLPPSPRRPSTCRPTPPVRSSWPPCIAQVSGGWGVQGKSMFRCLQRRFQMRASGSVGCAAHTTRPLSRSSSPTWDTQAGQSSGACSVVCC